MDRFELELSILGKVGQVLSSSLELEDLFGQVMTLVAQPLEIRRAALVLRDEAIERFRIVAAIGMREEQQAKGKYNLGEGITGQVLETGEARVIADTSSEEAFLNRTGVLGALDADEPASFLCVPIKSDDRVVGAISVAKPFVSDDNLTADARLLTIIGDLLAQAIRIHGLVQREKDAWLEENRRLRENLRARYQFDNIIGDSSAMTDVFATISQVAESRATVLLQGETGTGKEMIAKAIHYNSRRKDQPFVRVNCGALSETLLESELFGHVKGAFTGAIRDKIGRFEAADCGTIFLDEIGTLDPQLQVKLLRALQEREFERVGDHRTVRVDVRVIAATNLDLQEEVRKNTFREDLFYRLNVVTIYLPPLRNRREDIPLLIDHFLDKYNKENNRRLGLISREMMNTLLRYPWPGNVRELENAIERAVVLSSTEEFSEDLLSMQIRMFAQQGREQVSVESIESLAKKLTSQAIEEYELREGEVYDLVVGEVEKHLIAAALERHGGVKTKSADFLGINRNTLNKKVKELNIPTSE